MSRIEFESSWADDRGGPERAKYLGHASGAALSALAEATRPGAGGVVQIKDAFQIVARLNCSGLEALPVVLGNLHGFLQQMPLHGEFYGFHRAAGAAGVDYSGAVNQTLAALSRAEVKAAETARAVRRVHQAFNATGLSYVVAQPVPASVLISDCSV